MGDFYRRPIELDTPLTELVLAEMSDELLRMLRLLAAIHSNRPVMILQRGDVTLLKNSLENGLSALLRNRVIIERRSNLPSSCAKSGNTIVLVSDGEQL